VTVIRAALIVLIAFSVALVPVAGPKAHAFLLGGSAIAAHSDCCPQGKDCDKQEKGDCAKLAACALKCSSLTAATLEAQTAASSALPSQRPMLAAGLMASLRSNPPLPPPRL
jgi:hypothetical protein